MLDTSVVLAADVPALPEELAVSAATLTVLHFGVLVTADPATRAERLRRLALLERSVAALPVDERVARSYGRLAAAVVQIGRQPRARVMDLLIAATAHAHDAKPYTANAEDLAGWRVSSRSWTSPRSDGGGCLGAAADVLVGRRTGPSHAAPHTPATAPRRSSSTRWV